MAKLTTRKTPEICNKDILWEKSNLAKASKAEIILIWCRNIYHYTCVFSAQFGGLNEWIANMEAWVNSNTTEPRWHTAECRYNAVQYNKILHW